MKVRNKLNTMATAPGLDYIFDPGEIKEIKNPKELEFISKCPDIFEIIEEASEEISTEASFDVSPEVPQPKFKPLTCEICEFQAKSDWGLRLHKKKKKH